MKNQENIKLIKAQDSHKAALKNMFQLYLHDLSEYTMNLDVNADGIFESNDVDTFYEQDALIPMMIEHNETIIGFVLLNMPPYAPLGYDYWINDFFILRKFRGQGLGKLVASELFSEYKGKFAMVQLKKNNVAINFWKKVLVENGLKYEEKEVVDEGEECMFQGFEV